MSKKKTFDEEVDFIREHFRDMTNQEMAIALDLPNYTINNRLRRYNLRREESDLATQKIAEEKILIAQRMGEKNRKHGEKPERKVIAYQPKPLMRFSYRDKIEMKYPEPVIRQLYAKLKHGVTPEYPIHEVPRELRQEAGLKPYPELIEELAKCWGSFNRK